MKSAILIGVLGALVTGGMIGLQAMLSTRGGQLVGPLRTTLLTNMAGGSFAFILFFALSALRVLRPEPVPHQAVILLAVSGVLGVFIILGVSFSLRYTGVVAGAAAIILGQLLVAMLADSFGLGGIERIPFTWQRAAGLALMAAAVFLLLPRK